MRRLVCCIAALVSFAYHGLGQTNSATFVKTDTTTQGTWKGVYGADGSAIQGDQTNLPGYAQLTFANDSLYTWNASTTDPRALQKYATSDRIAATWFSTTSFNISVDITDGNTHLVSLYCLDWDVDGPRVEQIRVTDAITGALLDTRNLSNFQGGEYLVSNVKGNVTFNVSYTVGNAVVSGVFFGGPPPSLSVTSSHIGSFTQGQTGATYTVAVNNAGTAGPTSGTVTVTEAVPSGLTLVSMSGTGWSCSANTCTRSDALSGGGNFPPITATVNVASNAPSTVVNQVTVSGGGSATSNYSDSTTINSSGSSYIYNRPITISHASVPNTDQLNFPVLISGASSSLATVASGGHVQNTNGYDIVFTSDAAGNNPLSFEREKYVASTGEVDFWIKIPTLSHTVDTTIYMRYGNPSVTTDQSHPAQVWDANYKGVWHFANGTTLSGNDSTSNGNNLPFTGSPGATTGKIDGGVGLSGSNYLGYAGFGSNLPTGTADRTISCWFNFTSNSGVSTVFSLGAGGGDWSMLMVNNAVGSNYLLYSDGGGGFGAQGSTALAAGTWYYGVFDIRSGNTADLYLNGSLQTTLSGNPVSDTGVTIGSQGGYANNFIGSIDECRVSSVVRSADWIATEYNNQGSPASFYSIGSESGGSGAAATPTFTPTPGTYTTPQSVALATTTSGATIVYTTDNTTPTETHGTTYSGAIAVNSSLTINAIAFKSGLIDSSLGSAVYTITGTVAAPTFAVPGNTYSTSQIVTLSTATPGATIRYTFDGSTPSEANGTVYAGPITVSNSLTILAIAFKSGWTDSTVASSSYTITTAVTPTVSDSTASGNNGTAWGSTAMAGMFGGGAGFNAGTSYINLHGGTSLQPSAAITASAWINASGGQNALPQIVTNSDSSGTTGWRLFIQNGIGQKVPAFVVREPTGIWGACMAQGDVMIADGNWHFLVGVYNGATIVLYVDGLAQTTTQCQSGGISYGASSSAEIGSVLGIPNIGLFNGLIDEVRISSMARSPDWIATEYHNQSSQATFYSIGAQH